MKNLANLRFCHSESALFAGEESAVGCSMFGMTTPE
jgi:hypothetical protein